LSQLGRAVEFIQLELNHSNDKTSLVKPKALLPLDDFGRDAIFLVKVLGITGEVAAIRIDAVGWATLVIALGVTLLAHLVGVGVDGFSTAESTRNQFPVSDLPAN